MPFSRSRTRLVERNTAPPPVASTMSDSCVSSAMIASSRSRNPVSPSISKIVGMRDAEPCLELVVSVDEALARAFARAGGRAWTCPRPSVRPETDCPGAATPGHCREGSERNTAAYTAPIHAQRSETAFVDVGSAVVLQLATALSHRTEVTVSLTTRGVRKIRSSVFSLERLSFLNR